MVKPHESARLDTTSIRALGVQAWSGPRRRAAAIAVGAAASLLLNGCPGEPRLRPAEAVDSGDGWVGASAGQSDPRSSDGTPTPTDKPEDLPALLPTLRSAALIEKSAHASRGFAAEIVVNDAATAYPSVGPERSMPKGALLVEVLRAAPDSPAEGYLAMRKQAPGFYPDGGDWAYSAYGPDGRPLDPGANSLCARCHAEAPNNWLFGPPRR